MTEPFELHLTGERSTIRVLSLHMRERMSVPYRARARCVSPEAARFAASATGRAATLVIDSGWGQVRRVQSIVTGARLLGRGPEGAAVDLVLEPRIARLRLRQRRRVFQELTSVAIASQVLAEHGCVVRSEVLRQLPVRPYAVQVDETDLSLVLRLLADDGVFFFFEHPARDVTQDGADPPVEVIVLADATSSYVRATPVDQLVHREDSADGSMVRTGDSIHQVRLRHAVALEHVDLAGLDFQRPSTMLAASAVAAPSGAAAPTAAPERVTHELSWETQPAEPGPGSVELEQHRRDVTVLRARTRARHLTPGAVFTLAESLEPELCSDWVVVACEHRGNNAERGTSAAEAVYEGRFRAVPALVSYRPARPARPVCHGVETATVVGPEGETVFTDSFGRVRVRFPWERDLGPGETATTWLRVAQPWAGPNFGTQFVPRIGSQVLVEFVGGDPDRPVIAGCLYDGERPVPYALPENRTQTGIRTATVGGEGSNEIMFEDRAGGELVSIRGQRSVFLGAGASFTQQVGGDSAVQVAGKSDVRVGGALAEAIGGARKTTVSGSHHEETGGAGIQRHGHQVLQVDGNRFETTNGVMEARVGGSHQLLIGTAGLAYALTVVQGTSTTRSSGVLTIVSDEQLVLQVGESRLIIGPDQIRLSSPQVLVTSPDVKVHGEEGKEYLELGGGLRMKSQEISAHAASSALLLDGGARLEGTTIALAKPAGAAPDAQVSSSEEGGLVTFEFKNLDAKKSSTAMVMMPSGKVEEHPIPSNGVLQLEGKPGERFSLVDLRVDGASVAKTKA